MNREKLLESQGGRSLEWHEIVEDKYQLSDHFPNPFFESSKSSCRIFTCPVPILDRAIPKADP
jgi:hypothetical protein